MAKQVKFFRGPSSQYIGVGSPLSGNDVAYKSEYEDVLFYATDKKVVFMNGIKYGYDMSAEGEIQQAFLSVSYTEPNGNNPAIVTFTQLNGQTQSYNLFKITSKSTAINVDYDGENDTYRIGLDVSDNDKLLTQEADGLKVNINLAYDKTTKKINLTGKTVNGVVENIAEVDATDFVRDGMIKDVHALTVGGDQSQDETLAEVQVYVPTAREGEHYLKFTWNADSQQKSDNDSDQTWYDNETVVPSLYTYINLEKFFNIYTTDSLGAISINGYDVHFTVANSRYLSDSAAGLKFEDTMIDSSFAAIQETTINGYEIGDGNMDIKGTDISVGVIPSSVEVTGDMTSIASNDTIATVIRKINNSLNSSSSALGTEVDAIETAVGLASDGTLSGAFNSNHNLDVIDSATSEVIHPSTVVDAIIKLDNALYETNNTIEGLDHTNTEQGDMLYEVSQLNGQVDSHKGWVVDRTLNDYTVPTNGTLRSTDTIKGAFNKLDDALTWHDVTASGTGD